MHSDRNSADGRSRIHGGACTSNPSMVGDIAEDGTTTIKTTNATAETNYVGGLEITEGQAFFASAKVKRAPCTYPWKRLTPKPARLPRWLPKAS